MNLDQTVSAALEALRRGAFEEAEARSRSVLEIYPSHFLCLLILGDVSAHAGRAEEALQCYKRAERVNPGDSIAFTRAGTMQFRAAFGSPVPARATPKAARRIQMTTLGTKGRFGNQLLQYATVRLFAQANGLTAEFPDWIGRDLFDLDDPFPSSRLPMIDEKNADIASALGAATPSRFFEIDITGYFCGNIPALRAHKDSFRAFFTPGSKVAHILGGASERLRAAGRTIVAIHLRRTDFGYGKFWVAPASWYVAWLRGVWPTLDAPVLYIATDETKSLAEFAEFSPWDASRLKIDIPGAEFLTDHHILREADHLAIANSTFSFTAAMLNGRAANFMRPDPNRRQLVRFDPWTSPVFLDALAPPHDASAPMREILKRYFSNGDTVLHLGEHCAPQTNLLRQVHSSLTVRETDADTSIDRWRLENDVKHLRHVIVENVDWLPKILAGAKATFGHARVDILHFRTVQTLNLPLIVEELERDGYVLFRAHQNAALERLAFGAAFTPGTYMAIQERLLGLLSGRPGQALDVLSLCHRHGVTVRSVVHVGAHEGQEIAIYDSLQAQRVLFIEANPKVYARLTAAMQGRRNVINVNCAISDAAGKVSLHLASFDMSSSLLPLARHREVYPDIVPAGTVEVEAKTLDALMTELGLPFQEFNFLNVDVQGAEVMVLRGAFQTLRHIEAIHIEVNFTDLYRGGAEIEEIDDLLSGVGFRRVATLSSFEPSWGDAFYVRRRSGK